MSTFRRELLKSAGAMTLLGALPLTSRAQTVDTVRVVTGFSAGGTSDTLCRRVADRLRPGYARASVVENRTGAGGQIAVQSMKTATPDGTTVLQTPMSMLGIYPHIYKKLTYDPIADLTPVSVGCTFDFGIAVGPSVPESVKTVPDFLAWAKANPTQANYGSPASGSMPHFIGVLLGKSAGVELRHSAYRGSQPAILDMVGGQIPAVSAPVGEFTQFVAAGKCRLLGVSGTTRSKFAPGVPTYLEQGLKDMAFREWMGFYLPAKAPADIQRALNAAIREALKHQDVIDGLATMGLEAASSTPEELDAMLKADLERWGPLVKTIGFSADA